MYERRHEALAPVAVFRQRLFNSGLLGLGLVAGSLALGIAGYMAFEGLGMLDAFVNAAMLLSGMGPLHNPATVAGKLFAGIYALYCGLAVLGIAAIVLAPVVHRVLHRFHIEEEDERPARSGKGAARRKR